MGAMALAMFGPAMSAQAIPSPSAVASKKTRKGLFNGRPHPFTGLLMGRKGSGVTMVAQQRIARKHRNQRRHKRSVKA